jgi:hypothetical protein
VDLGILGDPSGITHDIREFCTFGAKASAEAIPRPRSSVSQRRPPMVHPPTVRVGAGVPVSVIRPAAIAQSHAPPIASPAITSVHQLAPR